MQTLQNFIYGQYSSSNSSKTFDIMNPATQGIIGKTPLGTAFDVDQAIEAATTAFSSWKVTPAVDRIQPLFQLKYLMEESLEDLARTITLEHGKTLAESRGSVRRAIQMVETATSMPTLMMGECQADIAKGIDSVSFRRPLGVFAGIAPFNFPAMVPFWFWPFAIAAGNTFVLKPSERVPLTMMKIIELLQKTDLPAGVMNMVHGGKEVVDRLCSHPQIEGVSFVGSTPVAQHVYQTASQHGKRVQALGGAKNIMVVLPDAVATDRLQKRNVSMAIDSVIGCAGQRCLAGSIILCVGNETLEKVKKQSIDYCQKVTVGDGLDPQSSLGPLISKEAKERVSGLIDRAIKQGAQLVVDGRESYDKTLYMGPCILQGVTSEMEIAREEVFGPVILLGQTSSLDEAIRWMNCIEYANTTTLFTESGGAAQYFSAHAHPSMIGINIGVPAPMSFFSFGGSKKSFFGDLKAHGQEGTLFFTEAVTTISRWQGDGQVWSS
ncbi:MAG: CoA-acylating methylmalonate-semialdehyde dehydrogenase [Oligoflexales bacterium]